MSTSHQIYFVIRSDDGWMVQLPSQHEQLGPYLEKESAIAMALVAVRQTHPSQLKISSVHGVWRADCTYREERPSA